jgi:hypothetical protein
MEREISPLLKDSIPSKRTDSDYSEERERHIEQEKEIEMRKLQDEIEKSVSSLFKNDPKIGQNRSTVIVDTLSTIVGCSPASLEKANKMEGIMCREESPQLIPKPPTVPLSPRLKSSPMNSPKISPRMLLLGSRVRSEGSVQLPNLGLPYTPMNTPMLEHSILNLDVNNMTGSVPFLKPNEDIIGTVTVFHQRLVRVLLGQ